MTILWVLAVLGVLPAVVALQAYWIERREGLPRAKLRAIGSPAIAFALFGLAWYGDWRASLPIAIADVATGPAPAATGPAPDPATTSRIEQLQREIAALARERAAMDEQIQHRQAELSWLVSPGTGSSAGSGAGSGTGSSAGSAVGSSAGAPEAKPGCSPSPPSASPRPSLMRSTAPAAPAAWLVYVALGLLGASFAMLLIADVSILRRRRRAGPVAPIDVAGPADVAQLAEHARAERWRAALDTATRIPVEKLSRLEVLDFLFLRALCSLMRECSRETEDEPLSRDARLDLLADADEDLARLLELAPLMAEAMWLRGFVKARQRAWQAALELFRRARSDLDGLPFDHTESVCLLYLGEERMAEADTEGATRLFDEVARLGVLAGNVPMVMVTQRILSVRGHIKADRLSEASDGIDEVRRIEGLDDATRRTVAAACDVYDLAIRHRSGKLSDALDAVVALQARWQPEKLPAIEDQIADEFLHPAIDRGTLAMPTELYRALYFFEAVLRIELAARRGRTLDSDAVDAIATALLRALQFEPRQRDALAALAALYLAYHPERSARALDWLDAAIVLGVRSPRAQALLVETRRAENQRRELLAMFRAASARFLADPALGNQVRSALIEELGRFDEFRPVLLDLQDSGALDAAAPTEVTIGGLHERAAFVAGVAAEVAQHGNGGAADRLRELHRELAALTASVDTSARRIGTLERTIMEQLGHIVLR